MTVRLAGCWIRPGLINGHDHFTFNHYPRLGDPPYPNLYAWAEDVHGRFSAEVDRCRALSRSKAIQFSAFKNLLGGVTRAVHHDPWLPDLNDLPVRVQPVRVLHSLRLVPEGGRRTDPGPDGRDPRAGEPPSGNGSLPLCMHLAEGTDDVARAEIEEALAAGLVGPDLLAVHLLGVDRGGMDILAKAGAAAVWCPSSSLHLYGRAASPALFDREFDVLLGTDSLLSAEGTLLHELALARREGHLGDAALERAVGATAARRLGLEPPSLNVGESADLLALRRPLLDARPVDVELLIVNGRPRYGSQEHAALFQRTGVPVEPVEVGGERKLVQAPLASVATEVFRLTPECRRILS